MKRLPPPRQPLQKNIMVAATHTHAKAMLRWLKHDPAHWDTAAYGDALHRKYQFAQIVRPATDVSEKQIDWILEVLVPAVEKQVTPVPLNWNIERPSSYVENLSAGAVDAGDHQ